MPRIPRSNMETSFFHIIVQGIEKKYIFDKKEDIEKYINLFYEKINNDEIIGKLNILAYCIMNNHAHILVNVKNIEFMQKWMHRVNTTFARYYNKKYDRVGYVFRNRYKSQEIKSEKHLYRCIGYIHENPVKANICKTPDEYKYSSYTQIYNCKEENIKLQIKKLEIINNDNIEKEEIIFLEDDQEKEEVFREIIQNTLNKYNIKVDKIKENKEKLEKVIHYLRTIYKIPYRILENETGMNRETLRKMVKNSERR